jgi:hypothetical protein
MPYAVCRMVDVSRSSLGRSRTDCLEKIGFEGALVIGSFSFAGMEDGGRMRYEVADEAESPVPRALHVLRGGRA